MLLCDECRSRSRIVLESRGNLLFGLVVAREAVYTGLDQDEAKL